MAIKSKPWPVRQEHHKHMKQRQIQNRAKCLSSNAEQWMWEYLKNTAHKWTRQAQWGFRLFDFWCAEIGVAVEVDGPEHIHLLDKENDAELHKRSGIVVLRVRNFNEQDADRVLSLISEEVRWNYRRIMLGIKPIKSKD